MLDYLNNYIHIFFKEVTILTSNQDSSNGTKSTSLTPTINPTTQEKINSTATTTLVTLTVSNNNVINTNGVVAGNRIGILSTADGGNNLLMTTSSPVAVGKIPLLSAVNPAVRPSLIMVSREQNRNAFFFQFEFYTYILLL